MAWLRILTLLILFFLVSNKAWTQSSDYSEQTKPNKGSDSSDLSKPVNFLLEEELPIFRLKALNTAAAISKINNTESDNSYTSQGSNVAAINVNGKIVVVNADSLKFSVLLQINTNVGNAAMGGTTIVIGFDTSSTSFKANPIKDVDYAFQNFCGGKYNPATVTRPMSNRIWINIDLPFSSNNNGTLVAGGNNWTDVVTLNFDVIDSQGFGSFYWLTNSVFWGIYDDDNVTFWNAGLFQNLINIPLPVELSSFTAKIIDENVQLNWITKTEVNNYGFDIERRLNENEWQKIGFVQGHGNCNSPNFYSYLDRHLTGGSRFSYRLKQIDSDGSYEYSNVIEIENIPLNFALYQNYPNPFNPVTKIRYQLPVRAKAEIKIFDLTGSEVTTLLNEEKEPGAYELEFNGHGIASGIYFYTINAGSLFETKKMILLK